MPAQLDIEISKITFLSTRGHVIFCLLYKHTNNHVFNVFPKMSDHFPKISEDFPKLFRRLVERFRTFSEDCLRSLKVTEDLRVGTDNVSIIQQQIWVFFKRLCSSSNDILTTCENNVIFSRVKWRDFHVWRYHSYARKLTWYFTGVCIMNVHGFLS